MTEFIATAHKHDEIVLEKIEEKMVSRLQFLVEFGRPVNQAINRSRLGIFETFQQLIQRVAIYVADNHEINITADLLPAGMGTIQESVTDTGYPTEEIAQLPGDTNGFQDQSFQFGEKEERGIGAEIPAFSLSQAQKDSGLVETGKFTAEAGGFFIEKFRQLADIKNFVRVTEQPTDQPGPDA